MHIVPDVIPNFNPRAKVRLYFNRRTIPPGSLVDSRISSVAPKLDIEVFNAGQRLVSIVLIDPDVPDLENDTYNSACKFLAVNIPLSPTTPRVLLRTLSEEQTVFPWTPPYAQKGTPYHRNSLFVLEQSRGEIDVATLKEKITRDGFSLRSFVARNRLDPVGAHMFRTIWDAGTKEVMDKAGIEGADYEFKPIRAEKLKIKKQAFVEYPKKRIG
jgi:large subunit ribosomal protein L35